MECEVGSGCEVGSLMSEVRRETSKVRYLRCEETSLTTKQTGRESSQLEKKSPASQPGKDSGIGVRCDVCVRESLRSEV